MRSNSCTDQMTGTFIAGVDVGGSGIRVSLESGTVSLETRDRGPAPRLHGMIDIRELALRIKKLTQDALHGLGAESVGNMAVGLSGMPGRLESARALAKNLSSLNGLTHIVIASDSLTTHIGALEGAAGSVVAAGTGAIALGTDHKHIWNRVDGWGFHTGDEGGGAWVGARGLAAALRCHDGRDLGSTPLLRLFETEFGDIQTALHTVNSSPAPAHALAQLAPSVAAAAGDGDPVARSIWTEAGQLLARSAHAAAAGLPPTFSWGGGLFDVGDLLLAPFTKELLRRAPGATLLPPAGRSLDGALALARHGSTITRTSAVEYLTEFTTETL